MTPIAHGRRENIIDRCINAGKRVERAAVRVENCRRRGARLSGGFPHDHQKRLGEAELELRACANVAVQISEQVDHFPHDVGEGRCTHLEHRLTEVEIFLGSVEVYLTTAGV